MDDNRFDALTKLLAQSISRRELLKLLGAGVMTFVGLGPKGSSAAADRTGTKGYSSPPVPVDQSVICSHKGHQKVCGGVCCAEGGTCETKGHARGVACAHAGCCSIGE